MPPPPLPPFPGNLDLVTTTIIKYDAAYNIIHYFAQYDYRFLIDVIVVIITTFRA
jgi:hypothetical protein